MSLDKKINYSMYILLKFKTFMVRFPIVIQNVGGIVKSGTPPPPSTMDTPQRVQGNRNKRKILIQRGLKKINTKFLQLHVYPK